MQKMRDDSNFLDMSCLVKQHFTIMSSQTDIIATIDWKKIHDAFGRLYINIGGA